MPVASTERIGEGAGRAASAAAPSSPMAVLSVRAPLCWSCGADARTGADACGSCGTAVGAPPAHADSIVGKVYPLRRGIRKRHLVCIGLEDRSARLLFESGETELLALEELPEPEDLALGREEAARLRTPAGRLLQIAVACRAGTLKRKWDTEALEEAALASASDVGSARSIALDALALGRPELLSRLPLSDTERHWLTAVDAVGRAEAATAIEAVCCLPQDRYRPKLVLLASVLRPARDGGVRLGPAIKAQVEPFAAGEPLAALLVRVLDGDYDAEPSIELTTPLRRLVERTAPSPARRRDLETALDLIDGRPPAAAGSSPGPLPRGVRTLLALSAPGLDLIGEDDIDHIPMPLLDDLIEAGAVDAGTTLAGSRDVHRTRYLLARLDPGALSDADVDHLAHLDEQARRAFARDDAAGLNALGSSDVVLGFQALAAVRRGEAGEQEVERIVPGHRDLARALLRLARTHADGGSVNEGLSEQMVADPSVWPVIVEIVGSTALEPTHELLERFPDFCQWLALHQAREHLFLGSWQRAVEAADLCLSLAKLEAVRDEALNLKACALHYLGADGRAVGALEEAIQGERSEALLANLGIVAAGLEPEVAASHLGMLMDEAPTIALRVSAAKQALSIWRDSDQESWRNSDNSPLPDAFQDPLRRLAVAELELADFRVFAGVLAIYDADWLADRANIATSPHADSLEARFFTARAENLSKMIGVMGSAMAAGGAPEWVLDERDSLRAAAIDILFENLDEPDSTFGSVALEMVERRVLATPDDEVLFGALGIASVTYHLSAREEEVADHIVERVQKLRSDWQQLEAGDRDRVEPVVELATRRVTINRLQARAREFDQAVDVFNSAIDLGGSAPPGSPAYSEALQRCRRVSATCRAIRDELRPWVPIVDHEGVREDLDKLIESSRELEGRCLEILG